MSASPYIVRNYRPSDYDNYVKFKTAAAKLPSSEESSTPEAIREVFHRPGYCPELNLLVAIASGEIIGATEIVPELASGRVILNYFILPEHLARLQNSAKYFNLTYHAERANNYLLELTND